MDSNATAVRRGLPNNIQRDTVETGTDVQPSIDEHAGILLSDVTAVLPAGKSSIATDSLN